MRQLLQPSHTIPSRKLHCAEHFPIVCPLELYNPGGSNTLLTPSFESQYYSHVIRMFLIHITQELDFPENIKRECRQEAHQHLLRTDVLLQC
ncbi:hypothetical protein PISMIDRAFT_173506 [Pisolithus microcarpus 441]|uniref:Uncharacterized protein n=1 Tax=Pisolithus microcarpus 441 TaxID=765257 RepID=A0A0C9YYB4_9AGAM|nr:hypothetical protein PISMIDRAFT_173506 [Pisolithus microcarpus 441]